MADSKPRPDSPGLYQRYKSLSTSKKVILIVFLIWLVQALPKWTAAITADGELSANKRQPTQTEGRYCSAIVVSVLQSQTRLPLSILKV